MNDSERGGIKMADIDSIHVFKSLRLAELKRIFGDNSGAWKENYLEYLLKKQVVWFFLTLKT